MNTHSENEVKKRRKPPSLKAVIAIATAIFTVSGGAVGYKYCRNAQNHVTVSFETNGGEKVSSVKLEKGSTLESVPCSAKENNNFTGWYYDEALNNPYSSADVFEKDTKLYAAYNENTDEKVAETDTEYQQDCDASDGIILLSEKEITSDNLNEFLDIDSFFGNIPDSFSVNSLGDGKYEVVPQQPYKAGQEYSFTAKDGVSIVTDDSDSLNTLTRRIHKDESEVVELKKDIVYLDWDNVIRENDDYNFYIPQNDNYVIEKDTPLCFINGYDEWYAEGQNEETFGTLFDDSALFVKAITVETDVNPFDAGDIQAENWYYITAQDGDLSDIIEDVDVFMNMDVDAKDMIDAEQIEESISESEGVQQLADILTCAAMDDETFQNLAGESITNNSPLMFNSLQASAEDSFPFRDGISMGNPKSIGLRNNSVISVEVKWDKENASNQNFPPIIDASDPENKKWTALQVHIGFQREIKGVTIKAVIDVSEYIKVNMQGYKEWSGVYIDFDYAANIYSQTNLDFNLQVSTNPAGGDWFDITENVNENLTSEDMLARYQQMIGAKGSYVELCDTTIVEKDFFVIPQLPIFSIKLRLSYVLNIDVSAGLSGKFTVLDATQIGMRGNSKPGEENLKSYKNDLTGGDRYAYHLQACGYMCIETGFKGSLSLSFTGLDKLGKVGISIEVGVFADLYGYTDIRVYKMNQYSKFLDKSTMGGYYMELGIYLSVDMFAESKTFKASANLNLYNDRWTLLEFGNPYIIYSMDNSGNSEYFMHSNSANILDVIGLETTCLDLRTGQLVAYDLCDLSGKLNPKISDRSFKINDMNITIDGKSSKVKAKTARLDLYCTVPSLNKSANWQGYVCYSADIYWADPNLNVNSIEDLKRTPVATYCLRFPDGSVEEIDSRNVTIGATVGDFGYPNKMERIYEWSDTIYKDTDTKSKIDLNNEFITEDTTYYCDAKKKQFYVAYIYYDYSNLQWITEVRVAEPGSEPIAPKNAEQEKKFNGWTGVDRVRDQQQLSSLTPISNNGSDYKDYYTSNDGVNMRPIGYYRNTMGEKTDAPLATYTAGDKRTAERNLSKYLPYELLVFSQVYYANYIPAKLTILYGPNGDLSVARDLQPTERMYISSDVLKSYYDSVGELKGWDINGDGVVDYKYDDSSSPMYGGIPAITEDTIFTAIYEQPEVPFTIQSYDQKTNTYTDEAQFILRNNQVLTFDGETVMIDGKVSEECKQILEKCNLTDAEFVGWETRYGNWGWVLREDKAYVYGYTTMSLRPKFKAYANLTFEAPEWQQVTIAKDNSQSDSYKIRMEEKTGMYWWEHFSFDELFKQGDTINTFEGWDINDDGIVDYKSSDYILVQQQDMTLKPVFKTIQKNVEVKITSEVALDLPNEILDNITETSGSEYIYDFNGTFADYKILEEYINAGFDHLNYHEDETGYDIFFVVSSNMQNFKTYDSGKETINTIYNDVRVYKAHNNHIVTFNAGENGYFTNTDGTTSTQFTEHLANGTYDISEFTKWSSKNPRRDSENGTYYSVDYWTDENGKKIEDDQFTVDKQGRTLTAHWSSNTLVSLKSGDTTIGDYYFGNSSIINSSMWLSSGVHTYAELLAPTQSYYPDKYEYMVKGWKDSRDTEDIVHSMTDEFTVADGELVTFTAQWELTGVAVKFSPDMFKFSEGAENNFANNDFSTTPTVIVPVGTYKIADFPKLDDAKSDSFSWKCVGWRDADTNEIYRFDDSDAEIILTDKTFHFVPESEVSEISILFNSNGGTFSDGSMSVDKKYPVGTNSVTEMPVPVREANEYEEYTFAGWRFVSAYDQSYTECGANDDFVVEAVCYTAVALWDAKELQHRLGYAYNDEQHWQICRNQKCSLSESEKENHDFDENSICKICGFGCAVPPQNEEGTYEISNTAHLYGFAKLVNEGTTDANAILMNDVTVNENVLQADGSLANGHFIDWYMIGTESNKYSGTFDGQGHSINGLYLVNTTDSNVGVFGEVNNGTIKNLTIADSYISGKNFAGGIIGSIVNGNITNCQNDSTVTSIYTAGIVSRINKTNIDNCLNTGYIKADIIVTGISCMGNGNITNCCNIGALSSRDGKSCGISMGMDSNSYYIDDSGLDESNESAKTSEQFESGEVAYLLSSGENGSIWGQTIGEDKYPKLNGAKVYKNGDVYSNGAAKFKGTSLSLKGDIGVNFYVLLSENVASDSDAKLTFTLPGNKIKTVNISDAERQTVDGNECYVFSCNIAAKEMTSVINAKINLSDGTLVAEYNYTVKDYADYILSDKFMGDSKVQDLTRAMLNYGNYSQVLFNYNTNELAGTTKSYSDTDYENVISAIPEKSGDMGSDYYGSSLLLSTKVTLRHYFKQQFDGYTGTKKSGKTTLYYVDCNDISPEQFDEKSLYPYSVNDYIRTVLTSSKADKKLKDVCCALYEYYKAAQAYNS